jgi:6-bladed beta-propeller
MFEMVSRVVLVPRAGEIVGRVSDIFVADSVVLVADAIEANVKVFSTHGKHIRTFGRSGDGPGEFREPVGVILTASGDRVIVLDRKRGRVSLWTLEGKELSSWAHGMMLANAIASYPRQGQVALFGTTVSREGGATAPRNAIEIADLSGLSLQTAGPLPQVAVPGAGTFRIAVGDRIGSTLAYTHSSTNTVWELSAGTMHVVSAGQTFYRPWDWQSRPSASASPSRQAWMEQQIWTTNLISIDTVHYLVAFGFPDTVERTYQYRYALMRIGKGEIGTTNLVREHLLFGRLGMVYGVAELEDGEAVLSSYRLLQDTL